jgi:hypothetical protein
MKTSTRLLAPLLAVLLIAGLAGCATSTPFAEGAKRLSPSLLPDVRHYAATPEQSAQADTLENALKDPAAVGAVGVGKAWDDVKSFYVPAFEADPVVTSDPDRLKLRRAYVSQLDALIAHEKGRPLGLGG